MDNAKVAEKTAEVFEEVLDATEETVETLERIPKAHLNGVTKRQAIIILTATALGGAVAGGGVTYFVTKRRLRAYYDEIAQREIAEARADYARRKPPLEDLAKEQGLGDRVKEHGYVSVSGHPALEESDSETAEKVQEIIETQPEAEPEVHNIFSANADFSWDQAQEESKRAANPHDPYVISLDEYMLNQPEHEQDLLTYFAGDDVLVDAKDQPIPDADGTVGEDSLTRFGQGTKEEHVVYVRNERLDMDFEIHRSQQKYAVEVLGEPDEDELRHSSRRGGGRPRKFREFDE